MGYVIKRLSLVIISKVHKKVSEKKFTKNFQTEFVRYGLTVAMVIYRVVPWYYIQGGILHTIV